jgi:hypothetical protein
MAFRLPHGLQDALRYALRSQNTGLGSRIGSNNFDHCCAFGDALCVLCRCVACDSNKCEQQELLHDGVGHKRTRDFPTTWLTLVNSAHLSLQRFSPNASTRSRSRRARAHGSASARRIAANLAKLFLRTCLIEFHDA